MLALKMRPVKDFIAPACEVLDPELVIRYLIIYRSRQTNLQADVDEIVVDIPGKGPVKISALVHVCANQNQPDFFDEVHQAQFSLHRQKKKWLPHQATLPDALVHRH
jgi:hypothetical protein